MQNLLFHIFLNAKEGDENMFHKYTYYRCETDLPIFLLHTCTSHRIAVLVVTYDKEISSLCCITWTLFRLRLIVMLL